MDFNSGAIISEFASKLTIEATLYFIENFEEEEKINDILNLTISGYLTSMFNVMMISAKDHPKIEKKVLKFREVLSKYVIDYVDNMNKEIKSEIH